MTLVSLRLELYRKNQINAQPMAILIIIMILCIVFLPGWWAKFVLKKYSEPRPNMPGTGGELAIHLAQQCGLTEVSVERTDTGDHYDPMDKVVRLSEAVYDGKSLTAVTVAAHEIGHAIQDHIGYGPLQARTKLIGIAHFAERFGAIVLVALPFITAVARTPVAGAATFAMGLAILLIPVLVHLVTLPVEFDASFNRALPILHQRYIATEDMPAARSILRACAFTYVAASLATLLNVWRWIAILRR